MKLREMGARIALEAAKYPTKIEYELAQTKVILDERAEFIFGTFKVSCLGYQEAVRDLAEKIAKGFRRDTQPAARPMYMSVSRIELAAIAARIAADADITVEHEAEAA